MPLLIRGGTVVNHDHSRRADVLIDGETIVAIGPSLDAPTGARSSMPAAATSCRAASTRTPISNSCSWAR